MDTPNAEVLNRIKDLVKISNNETRPLVIVTEGIHSKHYGFGTVADVTKEFLTFTTLEGQKLLMPWAEIQYPGLCPAIDTAVTGKAKGKGA